VRSYVGRWQSIQRHWIADPENNKDDDDDVYDDDDSAAHYAAIYCPL